MWISKKEMNELSENVRKYLDGECVDIRDNKEGLLSVLKNDIYSLVTIKNEEMAQLEKREIFFLNIWLIYHISLKHLLLR